MVSKVMFAQSCCLGFSSKLHPNFHQAEVLELSSYFTKATDVST